MLKFIFTPQLKSNKNEFESIGNGRNTHWE